MKARNNEDVTINWDVLDSRIVVICLRSGRSFTSDHARQQDVELARCKKWLTCKLKRIGEIER